MTDVRASGYRGFEQGPIRPPSEAHSLLIRVNRNCPWNRCRFCPVYKGERFSRRPLEHVLADIDAVAAWIEAIESVAAAGTPYSEQALSRAFRESHGRERPEEHGALPAAWNWYQSGMRSVFLQDANGLATAAQDMIAVLRHLRELFPGIERVTTYARSKSIIRTDLEDLVAMRAAGLNRIHAGFESGSDKVLELVEKGATKAMHIEAGLKVKQAGIELSAYYMPGLGGTMLWQDNALETADLMNRVDPGFIRLRTLAIPDHVPLAADAEAGTFIKAGDVDTAREILLFLENLGDVTSVIMSDHLLNLLQDLEGKLPDDRERMLAEVRGFLALGPQEQMLYRVGRRRGVFAGLTDLGSPQ